MALLSVHKLEKQFSGVPVLDGISFEVKEAQRLIVTGANGSGKTTLLYCLAGLLTPDGGSIEGPCAPRQRAREQAANVGFAGLESFLYDEMSIAENLSFYAGLLPIDNPLQRLSELGHYFGIRPVLQKRPGECSAGVLRRVGFVRAALAEPQLLILDEPFAFIDAAARLDLERFIERHCERGGSVLYSTNEPQVVEEAEVFQRLHLNRGQVSQPRFIEREVVH